MLRNGGSIYPGRVALYRRTDGSAESGIFKMREHVQDLKYELSQAHNELRYLHGFISYKKLYDEYLFFEKNAHEEYDDDLPFSHLTL